MVHRSSSRSKADRWIACDLLEQECMIAGERNGESWDALKHAAIFNRRHPGMIEQEYEALSYNVALACTGWVLVLGLPNEVVLTIAGSCAIALSILQAVAQCHHEQTSDGPRCFEKQIESKLDESP